MTRSTSRRGALTRRIVTRCLAVLAFTITAVAAVTFFVVRAEERNDVDRSLRQHAADLADALEASIERRAGSDGVLSPPELRQAATDALVARPSGTEHVAVVSAGGQRLHSSGGPPAIAALARGRDAPPVTGRLRTVDSSAGAVRVLDQALVGDEGVLATVTVLASLDDGRARARTVLWSFASVGVAGLILGGLILAGVARHSLRPLRGVARATRNVTSATREQRVPVPDTRDEVADLAAAVNSMLDGLEEANHRHRQHLAAVAHEVRTPLTVASGHLELLAASDMTDPLVTDETTRTVRRELERLARVLDDLLDLGRGADALDIVTEPVFVPDLISTVATRAAALSRAGRIHVQTDAPPVVVDADPDRLAQCLANLIENGLDHTPERCSVWVHAFVTGHEVALQVRDNGPGIDAAVRDRVREPFVTGRTERRSGPAGLGLAIVDTLVHAHRGSFDLESNPSGTTATLRLPVLRADET